MDLYTADVSESMSCTKAPQKIQKNYIISLWSLLLSELRKTWNFMFDPRFLGFGFFLFRYPKFFQLNCKHGSEKWNIRKGLWNPLSQFWWKCLFHYSEPCYWNLENKFDSQRLISFFISI
jgi:hypothetical protein